MVVSAIHVTIVHDASKYRNAGDKIDFESDCDPATPKWSEKKAHHRVRRVLRCTSTRLALSRDCGGLFHARLGSIVDHRPMNGPEEPLTMRLRCCLLLRQRILPLSSNRALSSIVSSVIDTMRTIDRVFLAGPKLTSYEYRGTTFPSAIRNPSLGEQGTGSVASTWKQLWDAAQIPVSNFFRLPLREK